MASKVNPVLDRNHCRTLNFDGGFIYYLSLATKRCDCFWMARRHSHTVRQFICYAICGLAMQDECIYGGNLLCAKFNCACCGPRAHAPSGDRIYEDRRRIFPRNPESRNRTCDLHVAALRTPSLIRFPFRIPDLWPSCIPLIPTPGGVDIATIAPSRPLVKGGKSAICFRSASDT